MTYQKMIAEMVQTYGGKLPPMTLGGHPTYYVDKDGKALCPGCAQAHYEQTGDLPVKYGVNWTRLDLWCQGPCRGIVYPICDVI